MTDSAIPTPLDFDSLFDISLPYEWAIGTCNTENYVRIYKNTFDLLWEYQFSSPNEAYKKSWSLRQHWHHRTDIESI